MHIAIDATNIRSGGGLTHLKCLLGAADPLASGIEKVTIWTSRRTADQLPASDWLQVRSPSWCNFGGLLRLFGQQVLLVAGARRIGCCVLFSPGGTLPLFCDFPTVTMSQNMLPFEPDRAKLFGRYSLMRAKMFLLRLIQGYSFKAASGLIFLTNYAQQVVSTQLGGAAGVFKRIPHGIEPRFFRVTRSYQAITGSNEQRPWRLLYVSILMPYKHQVEVIEAVGVLRAKGYPVELTLAGAPWGWYGEFVKRCLMKTDPQSKYLRDLGHVAFESLHELYQNADAFLFASSCENLPNILIEAMAAGLPIFSSDRGPMPEVLGSAGAYFDPELPDSIASAIESVFRDGARLEKMAKEGQVRAKDYSWARCAKETFDFIAQVAIIQEKET